MAERWPDRKWPDRYDHKAVSLTQSFKEPDHFWTSDMKKIEDALREEAAEAQLRALDELERTSQLFDSDAYQRLRSRIEKEGPL